MSSRLGFVILSEVKNLVYAGLRPFAPLRVTGCLVILTERSERRISVIQIRDPLVHATLARNHGGDGSGLYITGEENVENYSPSTVALTNVILVSHTVGITVTGGNTATVNGVLWYATPLTISKEATATAAVENEYMGDPAFAPDGFHLRSSSAAIDRGVGAGITNDIDGDHRPYGGGYDLGADESTDRRVTYLPVILRQVSTRD